MQLSRSSERNAMPDFAYLNDEQKAFSPCEEARVFRKDTVIADDGVKLAVYEAGAAEKPTVVLINPLGISCLLMARLARRLAADYHVITWESRGLPDYASVAEDADMDWSIARHCRDLAGILNSRRVRASAMVSYCSGANVAIYGLTNKIIDAHSLCLVSPSLEMGSLAKKTDYQRAVLPLWLKIAQDGIRTAALVRVLLRQAEQRHEKAIDAELSAINNLPFQSNESTYRYASLHAPCLQLDCVSLLRGVQARTLVIHGESDHMIHADAVRAICAELPAGKMMLLPDEGHFAVYTSAVLQDNVAEFLAGPPPMRPAGQSGARATTI